MYPDSEVAGLPETTDPDSTMSCDLMDGRDAFLTLARDKHWEFSSLRRAKYSTMCMLFDLHNQGQDRFVYSCNLCKRHVETRYHCSECEVKLYLTRYILKTCAWNTKCLFNAKCKKVTFDAKLLLQNANGF